MTDRLEDRWTDIGGLRMFARVSQRAIGGPVLVAMLLLLDGHPRDKWSDDDLVRWVAVQRAVLRHRATHTHEKAGPSDAAPARAISRRCQVKDRGGVEGLC